MFAKRTVSKACMSQNLNKISSMRHVLVIFAALMVIVSADVPEVFTNRSAFSNPFQRDITLH